MITRHRKTERPKGANGKKPEDNHVPEEVIDDIVKKVIPKISMMARLRAKSKPRKPYVALNPFLPSENLHPPGIGDNSRKIAMDDALMGSSISWGGANISSILAEGQTFLGYPYLSELAQRVEYRKVSETIATEMTRKWIRITSTDKEADKADYIDKIKNEFERLHVRDVFRRCIELDGFFGRSHLYIDNGATDKPDELLTSIGSAVIGFDIDEASEKKFKKGSLLALRVIEPVWVYPTDYNSNDPLQEDWYRPEIWHVLGKRLHRSRILTFCGREVPDMLKPAYSFGGLSLSQMVKPYIDNWLRTRQSVSDLIHSFSVSGLMTALEETLKVEGERIFERAEWFNDVRDNHGLMLLDRDTEEYFNVSTPLGTLDKLQVQALEQICTAANIPLVKYTGISPSGLNASSEGELRVFYDYILSSQEQQCSDQLKTILGFVQLNLFGKIDETITFEWEKLWEATEVEAADIRSKEMTTDISLVNSGILAPEEVRRRVADEVDSPYPGLDVEDMPEDPMEKQSRIQTEGMEDQAEIQQKMQPGVGGPGDKPPEEAKAGGGSQYASFDGAIDAGVAKTGVIPFAEEKHPRAGKGTSTGGQFAKGSGTATAGFTAALPNPNNIKERLGPGGQALPPHIAKLKIPPAWKNVVFNPDPKGKLLVVGEDAKGREQPIYAEWHTAAQAKAKFARIYELSSKIDEISKQNEEARKSPETKEHADCLNLIMKTGIRPGSNEDTGAEKKAYGATTLLGSHVKVTPSGKVSLKFTGKKGVGLDIPITDEDLAKNLIERKKAVGDKGKIFTGVSDKSLGEHVHKMDGGGFKTKDFRTYLGTKTAAELVAKSKTLPKDEKSYKKWVMGIGKQVATILGNTPAIAVRSYIDPTIWAKARINISQGDKL